MANNTVLASAAQDVVGVFDQTSTNQLFTNARTIKAKVMETAAVMSHPVEDGSTITDHKIINPIDIELSMIISTEDYRSVYESIKNAFTKSTLLIVQTRSGTYRSMIISAMPHDEDPDLYNAISIAVKLHEVKFAKYVTGAAIKVSNPKNPKHSSTANNGKQQPKTDQNATKKSSILYGWLH